MKIIKDKEAFVVPGIPIILLMIVAGLFIGIMGEGLKSPVSILAIMVAGLVGLGFSIISPNQAKVFIFFGYYIGAIKKSGLLWTIYSSRTNVSLRIINSNTDILKVNDLRGSPIEVGAVVVWRVEDAAQVVLM